MLYRCVNPASSRPRKHLPLRRHARENPLGGRETMNKAMLALVPALLAIGTTARAAEGPIWKVSEVTGDVKVVDGAHARAAVKGALLASGSVVAAGANARAVLVHDKDFVIVSPNSRIRIALPEQQKGIFQIISEFGTSLF